MITSYITLLPIDKLHADAVVIGITIKPIRVRDNVIEIDVVAIITKVSNDFSIVVIVLYFMYFFCDLFVFVFKVSNHFFNVVDVFIQTFNIV